MHTKSNKVNEKKYRSNEQVDLTVPPDRIFCEYLSAFRLSAFFQFSDSAHTGMFLMATVLRTAHYETPN